MSTARRDNVRRCRSLHRSARIDDFPLSTGTNETLGDRSAWLDEGDEKTGLLIIECFFFFFVEKIFRSSDSEKKLLGFIVITGHVSSVFGDGKKCILDWRRWIEA